jgi:cysteine desulfurase/selenocysteine lyase
MLNVNDIKKDFPIFSHQPNLVYLDSAATTLKPKSVLETMREYYEEYSANVARGLYPLSEKATREYETAREALARFVNASRAEEIVFTRGTTESLNLLAYVLENDIRTGDEIAVTIAEHHSNFLPWQALAKRRGATLNILPVDATGRIERTSLETILSSRTKILALSFVSNVLGVVQPVREIVEKARAINPDIMVIVDAAQAAAHLPLDAQNLGCDFLAFSGHKMCGPTGIGVLWGKYEKLETLPPFQYGGEMVSEAGVEISTFKKPPHRFEAGTPPIAGAIGLHAAVEYIKSLGFEALRSHELELLTYAQDRLRDTFGDEIILFGPTTPKERSGVIAFALKGIHPHDIAHILGENDICIRAGQHCARPLHQSLHAPATARLSLSVYNSKEDIDRFIEELKKIRSLFQKFIRQ